MRRNVKPILLLRLQFVQPLSVIFFWQLFNPPFTVVVDEGLLAIVTVVALELNAMQQ